MRAWTLVCSVGLTGLACIGPITEYSDEAAELGSGDGDGDGKTETTTGVGDGDGDTGDGDGDGDGDPSTGDGDGDPSTGDGDGDCELGTADCACDAGSCEPGYICVGGTCMLSAYPWGKCGWNEKGYYGCGFQGESNDPGFPIDCGDLPLVAGAPCPMGLGYEGCCAIGGDAWWCDMDKVVRDPCGG